MQRGIIVASCLLLPCLAALMTCPTHEADFLGTPVPRGARCCLGANDVHTAHPDRMAVFAGATTKLHWVETVLPDVGFVVYGAKDTTAGHGSWTVKQRCPAANEAGAFVHFIVDNWDCLPAQVLFLHDHRINDHAKYHHRRVFDYPRKHIEDAVDTLDMIRHMCWDKAAKLQYFPLSLVTDTVKVSRVKAIGEPKTVVDLLYADQERAQYHCCAQMAVTRETIRARGLEFWLSLLGDFCTTSHPGWGYQPGWVMEVMWDTIFGYADRPQSDIPSADEMYSCHRNRTHVPHDVRHKYFFDPTPAITAAGLPPVPPPPPAPARKKGPLPVCAVNVVGVDIKEDSDGAGERMCCREVLGTKSDGWPSRLRGQLSALNILSRQAFGFDAARELVTEGPPVFPVDGSRLSLWKISVRNPEVCREGGVLGRFLQGLVSNWNCLPQWVLFTDSLATPINIWRRGGGGFVEPQHSPKMLFPILEKRRATKHFDFTNSICYNLIPSGFMSFAGRQVSETVAHSLKRRMEVIWKHVLQRTEAHPDFSRMSYFPTEQAVVSRTRLQRVGLKVLKAMLADLCREEAPWEKSLTEQAYQMLWSTHIVGSPKDPLPVLGGDDDKYRLGTTLVGDLLACNNSMVDTSKPSLKPFQV